jgi:hypothetical protein
MAWYPTNLGGGSELTETTIWTNSDTTANFTAQDVTLSSSINNFTYIKIKYLLAKSQSTEYSVIYPASEVVQWRTSSSETTQNKTEGMLGGRSTGNYKREIFYISNTKLHFNNATNMGGSTGAEANLIPSKIIGMS